MNFLKKHPLFIFLILGLFLRLLLVFLDYAFDVNNHIVWIQDLTRQGIKGFYQTESSQIFGTKYPNYPPLAIFFFYLTYPLQPVIRSLVWWANLTIPPFPSNLIFFTEERGFLAGTFKLPGIIADLGIAYLLSLFARKIVPKNTRLHLLAAISVLFNPAFFYNSAYWGQIDVIPLFFTLFSFYLLVYSDSFIVSAVMFTLGLLVKPTSLIFLPLFTIFFLHKHWVIKMVKAFAISLCIFWISFIPFFKKGNLLLFPFDVYVNKIVATQSLKFVTNGAFNFWMIFTRQAGIKDTASFLLGISYQMWGYLITGLIFTYILWVFIKSRDKKTSLFYALFLSAFAAFLFLTRMHERYFLLPLPFLLLISLKEKTYFKWFLILSLLNFLNLYHSWAVPKIDSVFAVLNHPFSLVFLSVINVVIFISLFRGYIKRI